MMEYEILHKPSYALAWIHLFSGDAVQAESGAMVSMSDTIKIRTSARGGVLSGIRRTALGGESFFINTFYAEDEEGEVTLAPPMPGDIEALELQNETLLVQSTSFLGASTGIDTDTKWGGARTFFSREGLFLLKCSGSGLLFLSSYGAIHRVDLERGQKYVVDTGHMVAFDQSVRYSIGKSGGWKTTLLGGEGLVCKLEGPGRFYLQTRNEDSFLKWLSPKLQNQ